MNGLWKDFPADEGGNFFQLAKVLGVTLQDTDNGTYQVADTLKEYNTLKEYALGHGIPEDYLQSKGWQIVKHYSNRPAIEYPTATGKRYRFIDGNKPFLMNITNFIY